MLAEQRGISRLVAASVVVLLLGCVLIFGLILVFNAQSTPERQAAVIHARNPAFNLEQTTPNADTQALAATQEALLQSYGWVDQQANVARIPIDRAMQLIVTEQQAAQTSTPSP